MGYDQAGRATGLTGRPMNEPEYRVLLGGYVSGSCPAQRNSRLKTRGWTMTCSWPGSCRPFVGNDRGPAERDAGSPSPCRSGSRIVHAVHDHSNQHFPPLPTFIFSQYVPPISVAESRSEIHASAVIEEIIG